MPACIKTAARTVDVDIVGHFIMLAGVAALFTLAAVKAWSM